MKTPSKSKGDKVKHHGAIHKYEVNQLNLTLYRETFPKVNYTQKALIYSAIWFRVTSR